MGEGVWKRGGEVGKDKCGRRESERKVLAEKEMEEEGRVEGHER